MCVCIDLLDIAKLHMKDSIATRSLQGKAAYRSLGWETMLRFSSTGVVTLEELEAEEDSFSGAKRRRVRISRNRGKFCRVAC